MAFSWLPGTNEFKGKFFTDTKDYDANKYQWGGSQYGANDERARDMRRAYESDARQGPQIDQTAQNQTRNFQMGSLSSLQDAANGNTPSRAEALGQQMADRSAHAQVAAAGSVRGGPGAQAAAYRANAQNAASQRADAAQGIQAARADEIAQARGQLAQAAGAARGQDIGLATDQARLNQQQTALNDSRAMGYEQMGQNVMQSQLNANVQQQQIAAQNQAAINAQNQQTKAQNAQRDSNVLSGIVGAGAGAAQAIGSLFSDPDAKVPVVGSLSSLDVGGTGGASDAFSGSSGEPSAPKKPDTKTAGGAGDLARLAQVHEMPSIAQVNQESFKTPTTAKAMAPGAAVDMGKTGGPFGMPGSSMMLSAMQTKAPVSGGFITSDEEAKKNHPFMQGPDGDTSGRGPYERDPEFTKGVAGAPKGYAASRAGKPGYMFGNAPEADSSVPGLMTDKDKGKAPGTDDWERYGAGKDKEGDPDWKRGGATKKADEKKLTAAGVIGSIGKAFAGLSDETTKDPLPLYAPPGYGLRQTPDGHGYMERELEAPPVHPAFAASSTKQSAHKSETKANAPAKAKAREMSPDEMMEWANRTQGEMASDHQKRMAQGPAVKDDRFDRMSNRDMASAMHSMEPSPYTYKPEFAAASGQKPGEVNVGPMADKMARDPVARTAIVRDPGTGKLAIDRDKGLKVVMGSLASLQDQLDDVKNDVPRAVSAKKARRDGSTAQS